MWKLKPWYDAPPAHLAGSAVVLANTTLDGFAPLDTEEALDGISLYAGESIRGSSDFPMVLGPGDVWEINPSWSLSEPPSQMGDGVGENPLHFDA